MQNNFETMKACFAAFGSEGADNDLGFLTDDFKLFEAGPRSRDKSAHGQAFPPTQYSKGDTL